MYFLAFFPCFRSIHNWLKLGTLFRYASQEAGLSGITEQWKKPKLIRNQWINFYIPWGSSEITWVQSKISAYFLSHRYFSTTKNPPPQRGVLWKKTLLNSSTETVLQLVKGFHIISLLSFRGFIFCWQIQSAVITFLTFLHTQDKNTEQILQLDMQGSYL